VEAPSEHRFVETARALDVVGVDREVRDRVEGSSMVLHAVSIADSTPGRLSRSGRAVSRFRHDDAHPVRWFGLGFRGTTLQPPGPPGWHRLIAARSGACLARVAGLLATISTDHGMLVADGVPVQLHASERLDVRMLYLDVSHSYRRSGARSAPHQAA
jgi:hypothetical protein